jgi:hypothetical protein
MSGRRVCCPKPGLAMTRRRFGAIIKATALSGAAAGLARSFEPDFSLVIVPDPQFLAVACTQLYRGLMNWVLKNQSSAGSLSLNIKAVVGVGDCVNNPDTLEAGSAQGGWGILDANGFPWITPPGNHDMVGGGDLSSRIMAANFKPKGFFAADQRANQKCWGSSLPGDGGYSAWGGSFDSSNYYVRLIVGSRKLLLLSLEFQPRSVVLHWAKTIHDSFLDHECIVTTHSYLTDMGDWACAPTDPLRSQYNLDDYKIGPAPASNSGYQMWHGSPGIPPWPGLSTWSNVTMVLGGHSVYGAALAASGGAEQERPQAERPTDFCQLAGPGIRPAHLLPKCCRRRGASVPVEIPARAGDAGGLCAIHQ